MAAMQLRHNNPSEVPWSFLGVFERSVTHRVHLTHRLPLLTNLHLLLLSLLLEVSWVLSSSHVLKFRSNNHRGDCLLINNKLLNTLCLNKHAQAHSIITKLHSTPTLSIQLSTHFTLSVAPTYHHHPLCHIYYHSGSHVWQSALTSAQTRPDRCVRGSMSLVETQDLLRVALCSTAIKVGQLTSLTQTEKSMI